MMRKTREIVPKRPGRNPGIAKHSTPAVRSGRAGKKPQQRVSAQEMMDDLHRKRLKKQQMLQKQCGGSSTQSGSQPNLGIPDYSEASYQQTVIGTDQVVHPNSYLNMSFVPNSSTIPGPQLPGLQPTQSYVPGNVLAPTEVRYVLSGGGNHTDPPRGARIVGPQTFGAGSPIDTFEQVRADIGSVASDGHVTGTGARSALQQSHRPQPLTADAPAPYQNLVEPESADVSGLASIVTRIMEENPIIMKMQAQLNKISGDMIDTRQSVETSNIKSEETLTKIEEIKQMLQPESLRAVLQSSVAGRDSRVAVNGSTGMERQTERQRAAQGLSCDPNSGGCMSYRDKVFCPKAALWSQCLKHRPRGLKTGTHLGTLISEMLKNPKSPAEHFYPDPNSFFNTIVTPAVNRVAPDLDQEEMAHLQNLYDTNKNQMEGTVKVALRHIYGSRRQDLVRAFGSLSWPSSKTISTCFSTADAVNAGTFRSNKESPVDDDRFATSVKKAFRVSGKNVSLSILAFSSMVFVREYTKRGVRPALFELVGGGGLPQVHYDEYQRMHGLLCAGISKSLDAEAQSTENTHVTKTSTGWTTPHFDIHHFQESTEWLESYKVLLGTRIV